MIDFKLSTTFYTYITLRVYAPYVNDSKLFTYVDTLVLRIVLHLLMVVGSFKGVRERSFRGGIRRCLFGQNYKKVVFNQNGQEL